jgi:hypothetical protein
LLSVRIDFLIDSIAIGCVLALTELSENDSLRQKVKDRVERQVRFWERMSPLPRKLTSGVHSILKKVPEHVKKESRKLRNVFDAIRPKSKNDASVTSQDPQSIVIPATMEVDEQFDTGYLGQIFSNDDFDSYCEKKANEAANMIQQNLPSSEEFKSELLKCIKNTKLENDFKLNLLPWVSELKNSELKENRTLSNFFGHLSSDEKKMVQSKVALTFTLYLFNKKDGKVMCSDKSLLQTDDVTTEYFDLLFKYLASGELQSDLSLKIGLQIVEHCINGGNGEFVKSLLESIKKETLTSIGSTKGRTWSSLLQWPWLKSQ